MRAFVLTLVLASLMKTKLYAIGNWNTWLLIPRGKLCFRSNALEEVELSITSKEVLVAIDEEPVPTAVAVDEDRVEEEIPAGFGMYDHRESYRDS